MTRLNPSAQINPQVLRYTFVGPQQAVAHEWSFLSSAISAILILLKGSSDGSLG